MVASRTYREGLPYTILISATRDSALADYSTVYVKLDDGFWSDAPHLFRLRLNTFSMVSKDDVNAVQDRGGILMYANMRTRNVLATEIIKNVAGNGSCIAHIQGGELTSNYNNVMQTAQSCDIVVERPPNGQDLIITLREAVDPTIKIIEASPWAASITMYPIVNVDENY
jgi:hypothetical protein